MKFEIEIQRSFTKTDSVEISAPTAEEALQIAARDYDSLKSGIPEFVYEYVDFQGCEFVVTNETPDPEPEPKTPVEQAKECYDLDEAIFTLSIGDVLAVIAGFNEEDQHRIIENMNPGALGRKLGHNWHGTIKSFISNRYL